MTNRMIRWQVVLNEKVIEEVYYTADCDAKYVKETLINHDGFNSGIEVRSRGIEYKA